MDGIWDLDKVFQDGAPFIPMDIAVFGHNAFTLVSLSLAEPGWLPAGMIDAQSICLHSSWRL